MLLAWRYNGFVPFPDGPGDAGGKAHCSALEDGYRKCLADCECPLSERIADCHY